MASSGSSAIGKACRVLKALGDRRNTRLSELADHCGFDKSTTMRVLESLAREGFVSRDAGTKRYTIGLEVARIARGVGDPVDWQEITQPSLSRLVDEFEDTAVASALSGLEMVCVDLRPGTYPIRAQYQDVGSRRTLGVGSSGIAVLAAMHESERAAILPQLRPRLTRYPMLTPRKIAETVAATEERGYAVLIDAVVPRMGGVGAAVCLSPCEPIAAISIAGLAERIIEREELLGAAVVREASSIAERLLRARV